MQASNTTKAELSQISSNSSPPEEIAGRGSERWCLLGICILVALASAWPRGIRGIRHTWFSETPGGQASFSAPAGTSNDSFLASFFSWDADGLYHARRVEQALQTGSVAGFDTYLNFPEGAKIPWPPYYDQFLSWTVRPFLSKVNSPDASSPDASSSEAGSLESRPSNRRIIEGWVASVPFLLGILTSVLCALCAYSLVGRGALGFCAALGAGTYHALSVGSINYTTLGVADHHGWIGWLFALQLLGFTWVLKRPTNRSGKASSAWLSGLLLGALLGLAMGSWVATLVHAVLFDLVFAALLFLRNREQHQEQLRHLGTFGFSWHLGALLALLPAVFASPWIAETPWIAVNLSWFQPSYLALGTLVFAPLAWPALSKRWVAGSLAAKHYPFWVAACLVLFVGLLWLLDKTLLASQGPWAGVAEGFAWASRANSFMDVIQESMPLIGARSGAGTAWAGALGWALPLAAWIWWLALRRAFTSQTNTQGETNSDTSGSSLRWLPWVVISLPLILQAFQQRRFADVAAIPVAVLLGCGGSWFFARKSTSSASPASVRPVWVWLPITLLTVAASHPNHWVRRQSTPTTPDGRGSTITRGRSLVGYDRADVFWGPPVQDYRLGDRMLWEWLDTQNVDHPELVAKSVLSHWDDGHSIEWISQRPSIATGFGSFVGVESYADPARFFLATNSKSAQTVLQHRSVGHVVLTRDIWRNLITMQRILGVNDALFDGRGKITPHAANSMAVRLIPAADPRRRDASGEQAILPVLEGLRLVHVSPHFEMRQADPRNGLPMRCGWVYEHVQGAELRLQAPAGSRLQLVQELHYAPARLTVELRHEAVAQRVGTADNEQDSSTGQVSVRWPYTAGSGASNGDGRASGPLYWQLVEPGQTTSSQSGQLRIAPKDLSGKLIQL